MCGICGKFNFDRDNRVDPHAIAAMLDSIRHRGPDASGRHFDGALALGHTRLSIIDIDSGAQPMSNEDGSVWVVYNGEIYNYKELRRELVALGHRFKSESDTEVIVHMYEELGDDCVTRFSGMFAFALWDQRRRKLLLARDRLGIKPLYFRRTPHGVTFGSEIKAVLADPESGARVIDLDAVDRFLSYRYLPGPETLIEGVAKLEPGHCISVTAHEWRTWRYWDLDFDPDPRALSFAEATEELEQRLARSVEAHLISDVPVGVLLSGGVDSSAILRHASRDGRPLHTFTMGFDGQGFADERPYARLMAAECGSTHREMSLTAADFVEFLPRYVWHMEEPVCEPPAVALYFLADLARRCGVKVLLSGEGGDEAFGGYQDYRNLLWLERLKSALGPGKGLLRAGFGALASMGWSRGRYYADISEAMLEDYYYSRTASSASLLNRIKPQIYGAEFTLGLHPGRAHAPIRALWERTRSWPALHRMLYVDSRTWLPDDLLLKGDKMTMAASVELRVPLLDHSLMEFAAGLPADFKVKGRQTKRVLKAALEKSVPRAILERRKTGFPVPYESWMRHELKAFVGDTVLSEHSFCTSLLSRPVVGRLIDDFFSGSPFAKEVFSLLVLELWHRQFIAGEAPSPASLRWQREAQPPAIPAPGAYGGLTAQGVVAP